MNDDITAIGKDVHNDQVYINPFKAREYMKTLLSEVSCLKERVRELEGQLNALKFDLEDSRLWSRKRAERIQELEDVIKRLEEEKIGMVRLTKEDMKKLGWSYT